MTALTCRMAVNSSVSQKLTILSKPSTALLRTCGLTLAAQMSTRIGNMSAKKRLTTSLRPGVESSRKCCTRLSIRASFCSRLRPERDPERDPLLDEEAVPVLIAAAEDDAAAGATTGGGATSTSSILMSGVSSPRAAAREAGVAAGVEATGPASSSRLTLTLLERLLPLDEYKAKIPSANAAQVSRIQRKMQPARTHPLAAPATTRRRC